MDNEHTTEQENIVYLNQNGQDPDERHDAYDMVDDDQTAPVSAAEQVLWEGKPDHRNLVGELIILLVVSGTISLLSYFLIYPLIATEYFVYMIAGLGAVSGVLLVTLLVKLYRLVVCTSYKITTERLFLFRGWLTKHIDEIEMITVRDIFTNQSMWQRLYGIGDIVVVSGDDTHPEFKISSVPEFFEVKEIIRRRSQDIKIDRKMLFSRSIS